jgi:hypothetical protein
VKAVGCGAQRLRVLLGLRVARAGDGLLPILLLLAFVESFERSLLDGSSASLA